MVTFVDLREAGMSRCYLGLGGNVGDVASTFRAAMHRLAAAGVDPQNISRLCRSAPVGPQAGSAYQNACVTAETALPPQELLRLIHQIEESAGRTRGVRWGARPLDIDILAYEDLILTDAELTLPHPGLVYRRFVLDPLVEIAPGLLHPVLRRTVADLQQRLLRRPLPILLLDGDEGLRCRLCAHIEERFPHAIQVEVDWPDRNDDQTFVFVERVDAGRRCLIEEFGNVCVSVDSQIAEHDPLAAIVAIVTAMLDEPQVAGELAT